MIELRRSKSCFKLSLTMWTLSMELARIAGWNPAGTSRHDAKQGKHVDTLGELRHLINWQTEYRSSDGQEVSANDARQLAESLSIIAAAGDRILQDWAVAKTPVPGVLTDADGFNWFLTPQGKQHLRNLADFCCGGAFQIC